MLQRYLLVMALAIVGCARPAIDYSPPSTIVYKTRANYNDKVPVILSADRHSIVSYPETRDLVRDGVLQTPTVLEKGYLLDNRGIDSHVAFLPLTYAEYAALRKTPSLVELYVMIVDKAPLVEMYDCGNRTRFQNIVAELNTIIEAGDLNKYRRIVPAP